ncbi:hypothetical protein [Flavobacterium sp. JAS]|uniref:hypothetical protein n=1 Tax=Flavobacterium sp. JAS TaxID=2897329 RepID=UPI001E317A70|nr:hypothetical protein [Flavobacterium sp. JAS]MCD0472554.1 hypothetical protein [Flavobacterium sp. JAS]
MQVGIPACKPASSHAIKRACIHKGQQVLSQSSSALKKIFFQKKTEKMKKEKESNLKGRDSDRPKGIGISPEGCLERNEHGIMPKSFCQTEKPVIPSVSFYYFLDKI